MDPLYLFIQRLIGAILGLALVYSAFMLIRVLKNKEFALSMVFFSIKTDYKSFRIVGYCYIFNLFNWV